jgi:hypothetical protein
MIQSRVTVVLIFDFPGRWGADSGRVFPSLPPDMTWNAPLMSYELRNAIVSCDAA